MSIYWISRNIAAFILGVILIPARSVFDIIAGLGVIYRGRDGSEVLMWPWQHNWNPFKEDEL